MQQFFCKFSVEQRLSQLVDDQTKQAELKQAVTKIEEFSATVKEKLINTEWQTKRDIITTLIKQVEIGRDSVNIVFRVRSYSRIKNSYNSLEDCRKSRDPGVTNLHSFEVPIDNFL